MDMTDTSHESTFLQHIRKSSCIEKVKHEIHGSSAMCVLYGAANAAEFIHDFLLENGIKIDAVAVDAAYLPSRKNTMFRNHSVRSIEEIGKTCPAVNLFIGFYENNLSSVVAAKCAMLKASGLEIAGLFMLDFSLIRRPERRFAYDFVTEHSDQFEWVYRTVGDDRSKDVLVAFLNQRISMQMGELDRVRDDHQYFPGALVRLDQDEVYIDCGAFDGDSVRAFLAAVGRQTDGRYEAIYAFEPDADNFSALTRKHQDTPNMTLINKGAWSSETTLRFAGGRETGSEIQEEGEVVVNVITIDSVLAGKRATHLKMDIQGAEYEALKGAEKTIMTWTPKLAICVYHKHEDLLTIPQYILSLNPNYDLYLRAHHSRAAEIVLYGIPK